MPRIRSAAVLIALPILAAACGGAGTSGHTTSITPRVHAPGGSTQASASVATASSKRDCFAQLAACGYPDAGGNDGAHGNLTPVSGTVLLTKAGQVYENMDVHGSIVVRANDVTIRNVRVTTAGQGIVIYSGDPKIPIDHTAITDATIRGLAHTPGSALSDGVLNAGGNTNTTATRLYIYNSGSTDWNGPGVISDSYMIVDTDVPGSHDEAIFEPGGDAGVQAIHDTLLNTQPQTAVVFLSSGGGPGSHDSITHSLLGGGGWMIYAANGPTDPPPVDGPRIVDNRFVRCATQPVSDPRLGMTRCAGRADSHGYWPRGGSFGLAAAIGHSSTWSGNYWDDTLAAAHG